MTSALALADQGYQVHLVERKDHLGGNALKLHTTWRGGLVKPRVEAMINRVLCTRPDQRPLRGNRHRRHRIGGQLHHHPVQRRGDRHGIVVLAIGAEPLRPEGMYLYKQNPNVLLSLDLDQEIAQESERLKKAQAVAFIQCVGSRIPERPYCNKVCCAHSVENAIKLKVMNPEMDVFILYRDMRTYGERETLYTRARELGVIFIRYVVSDPPEVEESRRPDQDHGDGSDPAAAGELHGGPPHPGHRHHPPPERAPGRTLQDPAQRRGFLHRGPRQDQAGGGLHRGHLLAGLCHYPKPIQESVAEALACASRANTILSRDFLELESIISNPIDENCDGCAFCVDTCPFKAITLIEYMKDGDVKKTVEVNADAVQGLRLLHGHLSQAGHLRGRVHPGAVGRPGGGGLGVDLDVGCGPTHQKHGRLNRACTHAYRLQLRGFKHGRSIRTADHRLLLQLVLLCRGGPGRASPASSIPPTAGSSG